MGKQEGRLQYRKNRKNTREAKKEVHGETCLCRRCRAREESLFNNKVKLGSQIISYEDLVGTVVEDG